MTNPTHAYVTEDDIQYVFPGGYDPEFLYELPVNFWERPQRFDRTTSTFIDDVEAEQTRLWSEVKRIRMLKEEGGCGTPKGRMQTDELSKIRINTAAIMALNAITNVEAFSIDWTMEDNSEVTHSATEMVDAGVIVGQFMNACHEHSRTLYDLIYAPGATLDDLALIDIEGGWPT